MLDTATWNEVVEERFLGRLCGYPLCAKAIVVNFAKKIVVDKRRKMVRGIYGELPPNESIIAIWFRNIAEEIKIIMPKTYTWKFVFTSYRSTPPTPSGISIALIDVWHFRAPFNCNCTKSRCGFVATPSATSSPPPLLSRRRHRRQRREQRPMMPEAASMRYSNPCSKFNAIFQNDCSTLDSHMDRRARHCLNKPIISYIET